MKKKIKKAVVLTAAASLFFTYSNAVGCYADISTVSEDYEESENIWVIGDSISSEHDIDAANEVQITGWGNVLQQIVPEKVSIINKARSGRSSKSYTMEPVYREVIKGVQKGDYVIIQFGHNDEKEGAKLYTDPAGDSKTEGSYKFYLKTKYIEPVCEKGGRVILASSVVRHLFDGDKLAKQTHGVYATAMKELAQECQEEGLEVYFIDTNGITSEIYTRLGDEGTKKFHAVIGKGSEAKTDDTHYSPYGAVYMADIIAQQLKQLGVVCMQDVKKAWHVEDNQETMLETRINLDKYSWR